jgi:hypothetical protein
MLLGALIGPWETPTGNSRAIGKQATPATTVDSHFIRPPDFR